MPEVLKGSPDEDFARETWPVCPQSLGNGPQVPSFLVEAWPAVKAPLADLLNVRDHAGGLLVRSSETALPEDSGLPACLWADLQS